MADDTCRVIRPCVTAHIGQENRPPVYGNSGVDSDTQAVIPRGMKRLKIVGDEPKGSKPAEVPGQKPVQFRPIAAKHLKRTLGG